MISLMKNEQIEQLETSLIRLEMRNSYQDNVIEELNQVVIEQQKQLDEMKQRLKKLEILLEKQKESGQITDLSYQRPPHY